MAWDLWKMACVSAFLTGGVASAHDLTCDNTVNGQSALALDSFPATLNHQLTITNVHPSLPSTYTSAVDALLHSLVGFNFIPAAPHAVPVGGTVSSSGHLQIDSFAACAWDALLDGTPDLFIEDVFQVTFDQGLTQCAARVECRSPETPPCFPTRTLGFFQSHESAVIQCLAAGDIHFGSYLTLSSSNPVEAEIAALGILFGSPNAFASGSPRYALEKDRFLLARSLLVATCNVRLFGATPSLFTFEDASAAFGGCARSQLEAVRANVEIFNNSGDRLDLSASFNPGPATPEHAQSIAVDPSVSGSACQ